MKPITLFIFCLFICHAAFSQSESNAHQTNIEDTFFKFDSNKANHKLYLTGELHFMSRVNFKSQNNFLINLARNQIEPDYVLVEAGYAYSYILNEYLYNDYDISRNLFVTDKVLYGLYTLKQTLRSYFPSKKIKFSGVDFERSYLHTISALKIMFDKIELKIEEVEDSRLQVIFDVIEEIKTQSTINSSRSSMQGSIYSLQDIYYSNTSRFDSLLGRHMHDFKRILESYERCFDFYKINFNDKDGANLMSREYYMANSIYDLWKHDTSMVLVGQFGHSHSNVTKSSTFVKLNFTSLAEMLNNDERYALMNNKVCTGMLFYKKAKRRWYPFMSKNTFETIKKIKNSNFQMQIIPDTYTDFFDFIILTE